MFNDFLLLALNPKTAAMLRVYGILFGAVFGGGFLLLLLYSFFSAMQRTGKVMVRMRGPDGTWRAQLVKLGVNGLANVFEFEKHAYFTDDKCVGYENFPSGVFKWMQSRVPLFFYIEGCAQPLYIAERSSKTQLLASSTLWNLIQHSYMWVGTQFVEKLEQMQEAALGNPKATLIISIIIGGGVAIVGVMVFLALKNLDTIKTMLQSLQGVAS